MWNEILFLNTFLTQFFIAYTTLLLCYHIRASTIYLQHLSLSYEYLTIKTKKCKNHPVHVNITRLVSGNREKCVLCCAKKSRFNPFLSFLFYSKLFMIIDNNVFIMCKKSSRASHNPRSISVIQDQNRSTFCRFKDC